MTNIPNFILITGFAGSGKTTFAKALAKKINAVYINKDTVSTIFTEFILSAKHLDEYSREGWFYQTNIKELEYHTCFDICDENLSLGQTVILDIPFISHLRQYENSFSLFDKLPFPCKIKIVFMSHNLENERKRIIERQAKRDEYKIRNWKYYSDTIEDFEIDKRYNVIEVNSYDKPLENVVDDFVKDYL